MMLLHLTHINYTLITHREHMLQVCISNFTITSNDDDDDPINES